ncbi:MAG: hypothetical protein OXG47_01950 [bacterium]|nr:hypothetical protein [bacterium]
MAESLQPFYAEVDATEWRLVGDEVLGTKPKRWLAHPESAENWLLKDATYSCRADGTAYRKGDDWAERIAAGVAERVGIPAAVIELATYTRGNEIHLGVISKSVLAHGEALLHGNELLREPVVGRHRSGYTLEAVREALENVRPPVGIAEPFSAWDVFAGYLLLDAVIGNTDRHEENWAVIRRGDLRWLARSFDHASSLGFLLDDAEREARLATRDRGYTVEAWADRARCPFARGPRLLATAIAALEMASTQACMHWLEQCRDADRLVEPIWLVPEHRMSSSARDFAERVVRRNHERLMAW